MFGREPAVILAFIEAIVDAVVLLGLSLGGVELTPEFGVGVIAIVRAIFTGLVRSQVTPVT
jgi:hypothetical protein